jgi:hypothetical protein
MRNEPLTEPMRRTRIAETSASGYRRVGLVLTLLSFCIYAVVLFSLAQNRDAAFVADRSSVAAAVSNIVYGAQFGTVHSGVLEHFLRRVDAPMQEVFDEIASGEASVGPVMPTIHDGNGSGYILFATVALRLFGLHSWSLLLLMLGIMGFSALSLLARFGGTIAEVPILYFCGLTLMLFTALIWDPANSLQMSVSGSRYFTLVAILPAFHLLFEIVRGPSGEAESERRHDFLLAAQTAIFVLSILVRSSAAPTAGAVGLVWLGMLWRRRNARAEVRLLGRKAAIIGLVVVGFVGTLILTLPFDYVTEGRFTKTFWELLVVGLGVNPAWPFGDLRDIFDCRQYIPEGLVSGLSDRNGHCIWWDYATKQRMPVDEVVDGTYGGRYETAMREAFFKISGLYPGEVLATFFYYKPKMIISSIFASLETRLISYPPLAIGLLFANFLAYFLAVARLPAPNRKLIAKAATFFAAAAIPSYLVAWAHPWTTGDLLFYCIFCIALLSGVVVTGGYRALSRLLSLAAAKSDDKTPAWSPPPDAQPFGEFMRYGLAGVEGPTLRDRRRLQGALAVTLHPPVS